MSAESWEQRYLSGDAHWDHGEPSPGLADYLHEHPELPKGTVAIPGCGFGHDVQAWAAQGFQAQGIDIAPTAINQARKRTTEKNQNIRFTCADFLNDEPGEPVDYLWEHTLFCAIDPELRDPYVDAVCRWLKPGGIYLAVNYIICGPEGPPWPVTARELWHRFMPHFELQDQWVPRSYPKRCGKELMLQWRRKR